MSEILVGQVAPNFTLNDHDGHKVSLQSLRGRPVLLVFYPGDDTPVCVRQLCAIRDDWSKFQKLNVAAYGINPGNADSHRHFQAKYQLTMPLLVDENLAVSRAYDCTWKFFDEEVVKRTVVIIDKGGVIRHIEQGVPGDQELIDLVKKLPS